MRTMPRLARYGTIRVTRTPRSAAPTMAVSSRSPRRYGDSITSVSRAPAIIASSSCRIDSRPASWFTTDVPEGEAAGSTTVRPSQLERKSAASASTTGPSTLTIMSCQVKLWSETLMPPTYATRPSTTTIFRCMRRKRFVRNPHSLGRGSNTCTLTPACVSPET